MLWHNEDILELFLSHTHVMMDRVTPHLLFNATHHWNNNVRMLTIGIMHTFMEYDPKLFEICSDRYARHYGMDTARVHDDLSMALGALSRPEPMDISPPEPIQLVDQAADGNEAIRQLHLRLSAPAGNGASGTRRRRCSTRAW